jgi:hypothetical protein
MRHLFLFAFIFLAGLLKAQEADSGKVIGLHPSVGKLITRDEKIRYHLFPDYKDSIFQSAKIIRYNDSTFILAVSTTIGQEVKTPVTTIDLDNLYYRIEDSEKAKKSNDDYVLTEEERKEARKKRAKHDNSIFWYNFLAEMTVFTIEIVLALAAGT